MSLDPANLALLIPVILLALSFHEMSHAWTASRLGDHTARDLGRVTLDPRRHLDVLGTLMMFLAGFFTVAQFSFWGNYLPRVYPLYLRGTGESFAANIGGRLIGTSFAWLTATLAVTPDRAYAPIKVAYVAAAVGFSVYLVGFIASFWLPEPPKENLPD